MGFPQFSDFALQGTDCASAEINRRHVRWEPLRRLGCRLWWCAAARHSGAATSGVGAHGAAETSKYFGGRVGGSVRGRRSSQV